MLDPMLSPTHTHPPQENKKLSASNLKQQENSKKMKSSVRQILQYISSNSKNTQKAVYQI